MIKPDVQRLSHSEAKLKAYQDEKLEIYHSQMHDMHNVFEKARGLRSGLQELYELWNKEILDRLSEIRGDTDRRSTALNQRLRDFSKEYEADLIKRRKAWRKKFIADFAGLDKHSVEIDEVTDKIREDIAKEHDESLAQTEAETGPILEKLEEHRQNLAKQVEERGQMEAAFRKELANHFFMLKDRIGVEKAARTSQCAKDRVCLEQKFAALDARFKEVHENLKKSHQEVREAIEQEQKENADAQEHVVHNTMHFITEFEAATKASTERQEAAIKVIEKIREATRNA